MLFEQIANNKRKTMYYVISFFLFVVLVGICLTYYMMGNILIGAIVSVVAMAIYIPITISSSTKIVMKLNHAKEITDKHEYPHLFHAVEGLAMVARIPTPKLYVVNDPSPNAFATGANPDKAAIAVTTGLLQKLDREELEAVLAHEMAHIMNYDIKLTTISLALVSIVAFLSDIGSRIIFSKSSDNRNPVLMIFALVLLILAPIIAMAIQLGLSRNREYLADAQGAELCRNPEALASALSKITSDDDPIEEISKASGSMYFADPFKKKATSLFSTHPPAEERIKRLLEM